jgi:hypothetical protein
VGDARRLTSPRPQRREVIARARGPAVRRPDHRLDSTGIALQDSATVPLEYEPALAAGVGIEKKMIST